MNNKKQIDDLTMFAKALGHHTRIEIHHLDKQYCFSTGNLVDVLPIAQSTILQHRKEF